MLVAVDTHNVHPLRSYWTFQRISISTTSIAGRLRM